MSSNIVHMEVPSYVVWGMTSSFVLLLSPYIYTLILDMSAEQYLYIVEDILKDVKFETCISVFKIQDL